MTLAGRVVLVESVAFYKGDNNGYLILGAREIATRALIGKSTASRALIEIEHKGFIRCMQRGTYGTKRRASEYRLTWLHCDRGGQKPTNDFMNYGKTPAIRGNGEAHWPTSGTT